MVVRVAMNVVIQPKNLKIDKGQRLRRRGSRTANFTSADGMLNLKFARNVVVLR